MFVLKSFVFVLVLLSSVLTGVVVQDPPTADMDLIETILRVVVTAATPFLLGLLFDWLRVVRKNAKLKLSAEQLETIDQVARKYVMAAEQYGLAGKLSKVGAEKKRWVIDQSEKYLLSIGVPVDLDILIDIVEAGLMAEINRFKSESVSNAATISD